MLTLAVQVCSKIAAASAYETNLSDADMTTKTSLNKLSNERLQKLLYYYTFKRVSRRLQNLNC